MIVVSVCLPSDALSLGLPSQWGFSYLGRGVSLHGCSSNVQPLLLTLDVGYLLSATTPDLGREVPPLGHLPLISRYLILGLSVQFSPGGKAPQLQWVGFPVNK